MKRRLMALSLLLAMICPFVSVKAQNYALPKDIEKGNILHCFSWPIKNIIEELPNIAAAGFGSVQISPVQRPDINEGWTWYTIYLPYDYHVFNSPGMGSKEDLRRLCSEADKYGIKIIVDVVINHVNKTDPYYNPWFAVNGRFRHWGNDGGSKYIDYNSRESITHDPLGDYVELNTANTEVIGRAKAFIEELRSLGVKGIRYDAAKHIELPTDPGGSQIWPTVTGVTGLFHYGEVVGDCVNGSDDAIKEYTKYLWVPNNVFTTRAARENGGIPTAPDDNSRINMTNGHLIYWAESHDDYSNDEWSERVDQGTVDRAYCAFACRNVPAALYYSRPRARGKDNIKIEKGSTAFMSKQVVEVNKFRNAMTGKAEYFTHNNGVVSVTRQDGGAVIIANKANSDKTVTIANGGGYCPTGTYTDRVSGNPFTVTNSTITGKVGPTGVAVLYNNYTTTPTPQAVTITGDEVYNVAYAGNFSNGNNYIYYWKEGEDGPVKWPGMPMKRAKGSDGKYYWCYNVPAGYDRMIFNNGEGNDQMQSADITVDSRFVMDNGGATITPIAAFVKGTVESEPGRNLAKTVNINGDYNVAFSGDFTHVYYWNGSNSSELTWPGMPMTQVKGDDGNNYWCYKVPAGTTGIIFNNGKDGAKDSNAEQTGDLSYSSVKVMCESGPTEVNVTFNGQAITPDPVIIYGDYNLAYAGDKVNVYYWGGTAGPKYPGEAMSTAVGSDGNTYKVAKVGSNTTKVIFNTNGDSDKTGDLNYTGRFVMDDNGQTQVPVEFKAQELSGVYVYVDGWSNDNNVYCYVYIDDNNKNSDWPGVKMSIDEETGYWYYQVPKGLEKANVIVSNGNEQYPGSGEAGLALDGSSKLLRIKGKTWTDPDQSVTPDPTPGNGEAEEPGALDVIRPEGTYCYFYNTVGWGTPTVWAWNGGDKSTQNTVWPGDKMTHVEGDLWKWELPSGKKVPAEIIFSNYGEWQSTELEFVNGKIYESNAKVEMPEKLYMLGNFSGNQWSPVSTSVTLDKVGDGVYIVYGLELPDSNTDGLFNIADKMGTSLDWDNASSGINFVANRYGAVSENFMISVNSPTHITKYPKGEPAKGTKSWKIAHGIYDIIVDLQNMTLTVLESQPSASVNLSQLVEVQKSTADKSINAFDYITYPANSNKASGLKVSDDVVTDITEITVNDDIYHDSSNVLFTEKVLVTTNFTGTASYKLEPQTASVGQLISNNNFQGIVALNNLEENKISSKVNYYYVVKKRGDVKIPMQSPAGSASVKLALPEPKLIHSGIAVNKSERPLAFEYENIKFDALYHVVTTHAEIEEPNVTPALDDIAGTVYRVRANQKTMSETTYTGEIISPAQFLTEDFSSVDLELHTYKQNVETTGRWDATSAANTAASISMQFTAPKIQSCRVEKVNIEKQPVVVNGVTEQHLIETTTLTLDMTTEDNYLVVKNSEGDKIVDHLLEHTVDGDWYFVEFYKGDKKLRTAIVEGKDGSREFTIVSDLGIASLVNVDEIYKNGLWYETSKEEDLVVYVSTLYPFAPTASTRSANSMRRVIGQNTTQSIVETNASSAIVNNKGAQLTGIGEIYDTLGADAEYFNLQGIRVSSPGMPGIYVVRYPNGRTYKIVVN